MGNNESKNRRLQQSEAGGFRVASFSDAGGYESDTNAVSLGRIHAGVRGVKLRGLVKKEIGLSKPVDGAVLIYGMELFSKEQILEAASAAMEVVRGPVKVELVIRMNSMDSLCRTLFDAGVEEIFVSLPEAGSGGAEGRRAIAELKKISRSSRDECEKGNLKVKSAVRSFAETENLLNAAAECGIKHIIIDASPAGENPEKILLICEKESEAGDSLIEIACGGDRRVFRGPGIRERESEKLFLDVPSYTMRGRRAPLAAVFQLNFACNQKCVFCTADRTLPRVSEKVKNEKIGEALRLGVPRVVFTGGEPTLDKDLASYIARCAGAGVQEIAVYSNGMAFASMPYTKSLAAAGMNYALVSLHSALPAVSDRITGCPGGHAKTVMGIRNLVAEQIFVSVNYVLNGINYKETPEFVEYVEREFPGAALNFSYVAPITAESADRRLVPRFSVAVPYLAEALRASKERSVNVAGLEPHWGVPPCALGGAMRKYMPLLPPLAGRYRGFVKPVSCGNCALCESCPGVRENYATLYGTEELRPVKA